MRTLIWATLVMSISACGGGGSPPPATANDQAGDPYAEGGETPAPPAEGQANEATPAQPEAGPASVMVRIKVGGSEVSGHVRILDESDAMVSEGDSPYSARIASGTYTLTAQISDESILVDRPTHRSEGVEVRPGGPHEIVVDVPRAQVRLTVVRGGRAVRNPEITLMRPGSTEPVFRFRPGAAHIPISAGRYEADVKMGTQVIHVTGITFMEGATQDIPIEITQ
ncbi:MAG: hypothetical protein HYY06_06240 [Deltaproteobacteria bacterium]|nr:hypothetical protein [Deltaproteobacteria bacterium]